MEAPPRSAVTFAVLPMVRHIIKVREAVVSADRVRLSARFWSCRSRAGLFFCLALGDRVTQDGSCVGFLHRAGDEIPFHHHTNAGQARVVISLHFQEIVLTEIDVDGAGCLKPGLARPHPIELVVSAIGEEDLVPDYPPGR